MTDTAPSRPSWIRVPRLSGRAAELMQRSLSGQPTVCVSANCPNVGECWGRGTATFMIMGEICTRRCRFCGVESGRPAPLDPAEPERVAESIAELQLKYAVITCVDRDDLADGGAEHWAACIHEVRERNPDVGIEVLTGDFRGMEGSIAQVVRARPDVFAHNVEVVPGLQAVARPSASWDRSLGVLRTARGIAGREGIPLLTKTGLMLGLGESLDEVRAALGEIRGCDVDLLTLGQYLRPLNQGGLLEVERYAEPAEFDQLAQYARELGFKGVASSPLTRSSHLAETLFEHAGAGE